MCIEEDGKLENLGEKIVSQREGLEIRKKIINYSMSERPNTMVNKHKKKTFKNQ